MKIRTPKYIKVLFSAIFIVWLVKAFVITSCTIPSTGMENSLYQGERVLVNKWSYGLRIPFTTVRLLADKGEKGDIMLFNNPTPASWESPIFARDLYISRCVGTPGDTLMLNDELLVTGEKALSPDSKVLYSYPHTAEDTLQQVMKTLGIQENPLIGYADGMYVRSFSHYEHYLLKQKLDGQIDLQPVHGNDSTKSHPFVIPAKGKKVQVYPWNMTLLCNTLVHHEQRKAEIKNDTLYVEGKPATWCVFNKDYYWMASNNPVNLYDSRLFGLVPHDHLIGRVFTIWYSPKKERIFQPVQ